MSACPPTGEYYDDQDFDDDAGEEERGAFSGSGGSGGGGAASGAPRPPTVTAKLSLAFTGTGRVSDVRVAILPPPWVSLPRRLRFLSFPQVAGGGGGGRPGTPVVVSLPFRCAQAYIEGVHAAPRHLSSPPPCGAAACGAACQRTLRCASPPPTPQRAGTCASRPRPSTCRSPSPPPSSRPCAPPPSSSRSTRTARPSRYPTSLPTCSPRFDDGRGGGLPDLSADMLAQVRRWEGRGAARPLCRHACPGATMGGEGAARPPSFTSLPARPPAARVRAAARDALARLCVRGLCPLLRLLLRRRRVHPRVQGGRPVPRPGVCGGKRV